MKKNLIILLGSIGLVLALVAWDAPASARTKPKVIRWRISIGTETAYVYDGAKWWAKEMEKRSNGQFKLPRRLCQARNCSAIISMLQLL